MGSFINFRDVSNVMVAGGALQTAGTNLRSKVSAGAGGLETQGGIVFTKRDSYSESFWNDSYAAVVSGVERCEPRYLDLIHSGTRWADTAKTMGEDVVTAATRLVWQDAIAAAELSSANVVST